MSTEGEYRSRDIAKAARSLMVFAPGEWTFKTACMLLRKGVMRASCKPVEDDLHKRAWFKILVDILSQPLVDEMNVDSVEGLNISDDVISRITQSFEPAAKALIRWRQMVNYESIPPDFDVDECYAFARIIYDNIVCRINGTKNSYGYKGEPVGYNELLFVRNRDLRITEFKPYLFTNLGFACEHKSTQVPLSLISHADELVATVNGFLEGNTNTDEALLDALVTFYDKYGPPLSSSTNFPCPPPPPPGKTPPLPPVPPINAAPDENKAEVGAPPEAASRFELSEDDISLTIKDAIKDESFVIKKAINAYPIIKKLLDYYKTGTDQVCISKPDWKSAFIHGDARRFKNAEIYIEPKKNPRTGMPMGSQKSNRWRIYRDAELIERFGLLKTKKKKKKERE